MDRAASGRFFRLQAEATGKEAEASR